MGDEAIQSYRDLRVWREAMTLAELAYNHTRDFPREELFGLTSQIRRASVSIPANTAEGYGRESAGSYVHFLSVAQGSCKELETHLLLASRVLPAVTENPPPVLEKCEVLGKMLHGLIKSI